VSDPIIVATAKFVLVFGVPALVLALFCHFYLPRQTKTVLAVLLIAEVALAEFDFIDQSVRHESGLEAIAMPGALLGLMAGNVLAIPVARKLRSLFNPSARQ
jgi:hypothetical protein